MVMPHSSFADIKPSSGDCLVNAVTETTKVCIPFLISQFTYLRKANVQYKFFRCTFDPLLPPQVYNINWIKI